MQGEKFAVMLAHHAVMTKLFTVKGWLTLCRLRGSWACWIKYNCPGHNAKLLATPNRQKCLCAAATALWGKPLSSVLWSCGGRQVRQAFGIPAQAQLGETHTECLLSRWKAYEFLMICIVSHVGDRLRGPLRQCENVRGAQTAVCWLRLQNDDCLFVLEMPCS